jgi:hypothetical protein
MWQSFLEGIGQSGRGGGLFVAVLLGFFVTAFFWKVAFALLLIVLVFWLLISGFRLIRRACVRLGQVSPPPPFDLVVPFGVFALALGFWAVSGPVAVRLWGPLPLAEEWQSLQLTRLVVIFAALTAIGHAFLFLRQRLRMTSADRALYALVQGSFLLTIGVVVFLIKD